MNEPSASLLREGGENDRTIMTVSGCQKSDTYIFWYFLDLWAINGCNNTMALIAKNW